MPDSATDPLTSPSPITKVRSNTLDDTSGIIIARDQFDCWDNTHRRASSSEARLPSPSVEEDDDTTNNDYFTGINFRGINSSLSLSSSYDELETPPLPDYSKLLDGGGEESSFPVLRQLQQLQQQRSSTTATTTTTTSRGSPLLQTIESEKCLVDLGVVNIKPPKLTWSASSASSSGGSSQSNSPTYNNRRARGVGTNKNDNKRRHPSPIRRPGHKRHNYSFSSQGEGSLISQDESLVSHYSVDAGKHGFLSHAANAHLEMTEGGDGGLCRDSSYIDRQKSSDSVISGGENDSLIFKYNPGKETPPAEYALPASILKVYGDTELLDDSPISIDRKLLSLLPSLAKTTTTTSVDTTVHLLDGKTAKLDAIQSRLSPLPTSSLPLNDAVDDGLHSSKIRTTHMIALMAGEDDNDDQDDEDNGKNNMEEQERILPYHERKRLEKLRAAEEKRRERIITKNSKKKTTTVSIKDNNRVVDIGERSQLNVDTYGYGGIDNNGVHTSTADVDKNEESTINGLSNKGWFGGLVALVTSQDGKSSKAKENNDEEEGQLTSNSYREQADAFLRRTERERMMMKESSMRASSFNGCHRARRSTGSSVLVSIASCSDDDDDDDGYCSDDVSDTDDSDDDDETEESEPSTTPVRVWKYGEPPTLPNHTIHSATKRDCIMRRDRLLQEEYDYKLHTYKKRHEATSKKFRIFILISVGIIFVGIFGFAFAVCVRMLTSLQ